MKKLLLFALAFVATAAVARTVIVVAAVSAAPGCVMDASQINNCSVQ